MDDVDRAQERELIARAAAIAQASKDLPAGEPGECDFCGNHSPRLIRGACARCRDDLGLDKPMGVRR